MSFDTRTWTHLGFVRQYPFDLAVISLAAIAAYAAVTSYPAGSTLRLLATFPLVLFIPGYALVSVLFPGTERTVRHLSGPLESVWAGIDVVERLGLSVALSLAIVPIVVLVLPFGAGLGTVSIAATLAGLSVVFAQLGVIRRLRTPQPQRFVVSPIAGINRLRANENAVATLSSILLVGAIALAAGALLLGFLAPASADGFTELGLYTEDDDGDLVAGEIQNEVEPGDSVPVTIALENNEGERTDYSVIVQEQVLEDGEIVERTELEQLDASVADGETATTDQSITPTVDEDETVRVSVLLYEGEPPEEPTNENADTETYFWVTVTDDPDTDDD
ncbi:DUF1616 domain-containing protein [Natrarchaeobaculum sulfurireducens]|uniref:DUF1616 domain-containing protein n=1 Tax=Natrarchaeobaculum sulfurireducens TaxID=2044521 RepID=UPI000E3D9928|nr:DUF1616 domain-containing protein [Natrarchaeobaculum sulfurireducens]